MDGKRMRLVRKGLACLLGAFELDGNGADTVDKILNANEERIALGKELGIGYGELWRMADAMGVGFVDINLVMEEELWQTKN